MHRLQKDAIIFRAFKKIQECQKEQSVSKWKDTISEKFTQKSGKWILIYDYFLLRGLSPHANYTDRAAAAGRRSLVPTFCG